MSPRFNQSTEANRGIRLSSQCTGVAGRYCNDRLPLAANDWQQSRHFFRLAAIGKDHPDIIASDATQVTMQGFGRVQEIGPGPSR